MHKSGRDSSDSSGYFGTPLLMSFEPGAHSLHSIAVPCLAKELIKARVNLFLEPSIRHFHCSVPCLYCFTLSHLSDKPAFIKSSVDYLTDLLCLKPLTYFRVYPKEVVSANMGTGLKIH